MTKPKEFPKDLFMYGIEARIKAIEKQSKEVGKILKRMDKRLQRMKARQIRQHKVIKKEIAK